MNEIMTFVNEEFGSVRTVSINSEPWLVGKDVAMILGYRETAKAIRAHVDEEDKGVSVLDTPGGKQKLGHSELETTQKYLHYLSEADKEAVNVLTNMLEPSKGGSAKKSL